MKQINADKILNKSQWVFNLSSSVPQEFRLRVKQARRLFSGSLLTDYVNVKVYLVFVKAL